VRVETARELGDGDRDRVQRLLDAAADADGRAPLSERKSIDLLEEGPEGLATVLVDDGGDLVGLAQVSGHPGHWGVELVVEPRHRESAEIGEALVGAALAAVAAAGGGHVHLWVTAAGRISDAVAAAHGLEPKRELHQLRRALPVGEAFDLPTRAFVPGRDDDVWLAVNNRAFAGHPEQSGWTRATLEARMREPWFDAEGFRLHEREGRLAGFCWTKVHPSGVGEIYVIGIDPDFQGRRLGRPLVLAGLDWLAGHGVEEAMLYVDGGNRSALRLYDDLGFHVDHVDRAYVTDVGDGEVSR
jgi:mycothiol synthase